MVLLCSVYEYQTFHFQTTNIHVSSHFSAQLCILFILILGLLTDHRIFSIQQLCVCDEVVFWCKRLTWKELLEHSSFICFCWKLEGDTLENSCQWRCFQNCFQTISTTSQIFVSAKWLFFIPNYSQRTGSWGVMRRWCEDCEKTWHNTEHLNISSFSHINSNLWRSSIFGCENSPICHKLW